MKKNTVGDADALSPSGTSAISRRTFIQGVVAASAAATSLTSAPLIALSPDASSGVLTTAQRTSLTVVLNHLIPHEGVMPGAGSIGIGAFIEQALAAAPHLQRPITAVLAALPESDTLVQLSEDDIRAHLESIERTQPEAFDLLLQATYTGYYRHPAVLSALGNVESDQMGELRLDAFHPDDLDRLTEGA